MRALALAFALIVPATVSLSAQTARMVKVDIVKKSDFEGHGKKIAKGDGPTEVKMRMPITVVKAFLSSVDESEIKVNGKAKKGIKVDEMVKLLENGKVGDLLLEITTDKGDLVKISLE